MASSLAPTATATATPPTLKARPSAAWFCTEPQEHELKRFLPELASVPLSEEVPRGQSGHGNRVAMVRVESSGFAWRAERVVGGWAWLLVRGGSGGSVGHCRLFMVVLMVVPFLTSSFVAKSVYCG